MREPGYYFVKWFKDDEWEIAFNDGHKIFPWSMIGSDESFKEDAVRIVGDKIEIPK